MLSLTSVWQQLCQTSRIGSKAFQDNLNRCRYRITAASMNQAMRSDRRQRYRLDHARTLNSQMANQQRFLSAIASSAALRAVALLADSSRCVDVYFKMFVCLPPRPSAARICFYRIRKCGVSCATPRDAVESRIISSGWMIVPHSFRQKNLGGASPPATLTGPGAPISQARIAKDSDFMADGDNQGRKCKH